MSALAWLALAAGLMLVPLPAPGGLRVAGLVGRGRLAVAAAPRHRSPRLRIKPAAVALVGCAAATATAALAGGLALGLAAIVVASTGAGLLRAAAGRRHDVRRRRELLTAVRLLVAELEAGSTPQAALRAGAAVAPQHSPALKAAADSAESGGDAAAALLSAGGSDLEPLAHAWRVGALSGAPLAAVLGRVAAELANRDDQQRAVAVALAGPKSSALLLAGLPAVGLALGSAMGARPVPFLLGTPGGRLLCCAGVVLDAAGVLWTQRLMQRAERA